MEKFKIDVTNFSWINGVEDDVNDLCLHGHVNVIIGDTRLEYDATVSATALYLLKTLTENHIIYEDNQMIPCCGHFLIPNDDLTNVNISGCPNGIDWTVLHEGDEIKLILESGEETIVPLEEYKAEVFQFADKVEAYYKSCLPKVPFDDWQEKGYVAFWNEWHRRREK